MPVSENNSRLIYQALKACGVRLLSALPETWLVHLIRMAEDDPEMLLVRLAKEEEGVGISAGVCERNQPDPSDTPWLLRLRRARSVGVSPSIRRKVRVKCAPSENPAL